MKTTPPRRYRVAHRNLLRIGLGAALAAATAAAVALGAQAPPTLCADGSERSGGWCEGDLFVGIGGPAVYDGIYIPIPMWDANGKAVERLDPAGHPVLQSDEGWRNATRSSRFVRNPATGQPVCQFSDSHRVDAAGTPSAGYSCPVDAYILFEPVCIDVATGLDTAGGEWDWDGNALCPRSPHPTQPTYTVTLPQAQNAGIVLLADANGNFPPGGSQRVVNPAGGLTYSCEVDPGNGHVWTTDFITNKIHEFSATGTSPLQTFDLSDRTLGPKCGHDTYGVIGGCGGVGPIVFARENGVTTDFFVGTTMGGVGDMENVSKIVRYHHDDTWASAEEYVVPVSATDGQFTNFDTPPAGGVTGLDLAADRETMFYTSADAYIRVFNVDRRPLADTDLGARLIHHGLQLIDANHQLIASNDPGAATALFGQIPITHRGDNTLWDWPAYQIRLLPPGDPLKFDPVTHEQVPTGILVALGGTVAGADVNLLDFRPADPANGHPVLTAHNRQGYVHDMRDQTYMRQLNQFTAFDLTPDGRSFWTGGAAGGTGTAQMLKWHIPSRTLEVPEPITVPGGASTLTALCIVKGYAAGATQPDCTANPLVDPYNLCNPGPPELITPVALTSYEGDVIGDLPLVSARGASSYSARGLPPGLQFDERTGLVSSNPIVGANSSLPEPYAVTVGATTHDGSSETRVDWTILDWNLPPPLEVVTGDLSLSAIRGEPIAIELSAEDPDACNSVFFTLAPGSAPLPPGLTITQGPPPPDAQQKCVWHVSDGPYTATITGNVTSLAGGTPTPKGASFTFTVLAKDTHEGDTARDVNGEIVRVRGIGDRQTQTFTIDVADYAPVIVVSAPAVVEATSRDGAVVTFDARGSYDPESAGTLTFAWSRNGSPLGASPTLAVALPIGVSAVHLEVTDDVGRRSTRDIQVVVADTTPPLLLGMPPGQVLQAAGPDGATFAFAPTAIDVVDGSVPVSCDRASGSMFPVGSTLVTCTAIDARRNAASAAFVVTVKQAPPLCAAARPSVSELWPANHKLVVVGVLGVTDPGMSPLTIAIDRVLQDEPTNGLGDGDTPIDAIVGGSTVQLRAERSGKGDGRVYVIEFTATNAGGARCAGTVTASVPQNKGKKGPAIDSLVRYDSVR